MNIVCYTKRRNVGNQLNPTLHRDEGPMINVTKRICFPSLAGSKLTLEDCVPNLFFEGHTQTLLHFGASGNMCHFQMKSVRWWSIADWLSDTTANLLITDEQMYHDTIMFSKVQTRGYWYCSDKCLANINCKSELSVAMYSWEGEPHAPTLQLLVLKLLVSHRKFLNGNSAQNRISENI